jgi:hypothetical protein
MRKNHRPAWLHNFKKGLDDIPIIKRFSEEELFPKQSA